MPLVSVIVPVYNAEKYVAVALASLLVQDHRDIEIIAINDGSTDRSGDILRAIAFEDRRVRLIERPNKGLIATLNEGLAMARGDLVARMDADDIAYPQRISEQVRAFATDAELAMCGCNFDTIFSGQNVSPRRPPEFTESHDLRILARFCTILRHPSVMFRRSLIPDGMLQYDASYPHAEDFDLFRRIAESCRVVQLAQPLMAYRVHDGSVSLTRTDAMAQTHLRIVEENMARHYPSVAGTGFVALADETTRQTVSSAATMVRRLDKIASTQPMDERPAFEMGALINFYFLYAHICRSERYDLACDFVEATDKWHLIRRRERPLLKAAHRLPRLVPQSYHFLNFQANVSRTIAARRLSDVVPHHDTILAMSRRVAAFSPSRGHSSYVQH